MNWTKTNLRLLAVVGGMLLLVAWRWPWSAAPEDPTSLVAHLGAKNWQAQVIAAKQPVIVEFGASWCPTCRDELPLLDSLSRTVSGTALVGEVDIDRDGPLAQQYGVNEMPTLLIFKGGKVVKGFEGYTKVEILKAALDAAR
jgi:thioredoxin 1